MSIADTERQTAATYKCWRLRFCQLSPAERQASRARAQECINREIGRARPSAVAKMMSDGWYDEPGAGELKALEVWALRRPSF